MDVDQRQPRALGKHVQRMCPGGRTRMNWMESNQAKALQYAHDKARAEKESRKLATEEKALRAYKRAAIGLSPDRKLMREIEEHAAANGWESIAAWKRGVEERRAYAARIAQQKDEAERQAVSEQIASITTRQEAIDAYKAARAADNRHLTRAITQAARTNGWNIMTKPLNDYAQELHIELMDVIAQHDTTSRVWRDELNNKRVTPDYVNEQIAGNVTANRDKINDLLTGVQQYVTDAQTEYDNTFQSFVTPTGDTNEQLLAEIRAGKTWDRTQRELSSVPETQITAEVTNRIRNADASTLKVYLEEMPSYLASKGLSNAADVVRTAVQQSRPELQEAQARVTQATKLHDLVSHNARQISERLNTVTPADATPRDLIGYVDPTSIKY
ncbi:MAG: hypothetical protein ACRDT7_07995 [Microbacterium sp.]